MKPAVSIRPARADDIPRVEAIAVAAKMFGAEEVGFIGERFAAGGDGAHWLVAERDAVIVGAAYYAPEPFADRMWNLYFIAVDPAAHGQGIGRGLMAVVESALRDAGPSVARTLVVETSSTAQYAGTRAFYRRIGYDEEARIRQFYGPEDDKIVFWKSLVG